MHMLQCYVEVIQQANKSIDYNGGVIYSQPLTSATKGLIKTLKILLEGFYIILQLFADNIHGDKSVILKFR